MPSISFANPANNVASSLSTPVSAGASQIPLIPNGGSIFPNAPFYVSCEFEVMYCVGKTGDTLTVNRGVDGTTAAQHPASAIVEIRNNAALWKDAYNAINSNSAVVDQLTSNVYSGAALPPTVVYKDSVQELTHKTIDLTDPTKANSIIGTVTPDLAQFPYNNVLANGGFDQWSGPVSTNIPAGSAASGLKTAYLAPFWNLTATNDSFITGTRDTTNPDTPAAGYDLLVNMSTVQANDYVEVAQPIDNQRTINFDGVVGVQFSANARIKSINGAIQVAFRFQYTDAAGAVQSDLGPFVAVTSTSYLTYKREGIIWFPSLGIRSAQVSLCFKGVGQIAIDNIMVINGPLAANFRPNFPLTPIYAPNLIQNGAFEQWHRGAGPFATTGTFTADQWYLNIDGTDTLSLSRDSVNQDSGQYCAACVYTKGSGTITTLYQALYGNPAWPAQIHTYLAGKTITISARIKTSVANAVRLTIHNGTAWTYGSYHNGNGQYQTITHTASILAASASSVVGINFSVSCTAYIDNVSCVIGSVPVDYQPVQIPDAIPNERLASDVARTNLIPNGGFENWQRGNGPFTVNWYSADRWIAGWSNTTPTFTITKETSNVDIASGASLKIVISNVGGGFVYLQNLVPASEINMTGKYYSVSARVYSSVAGAVRFSPTSVTNSLVNTWETLTTTIAAPVTGGASMAPSIQFTQPGTFYVDNVMVVAGTVPADYVPMHPADDLARCLRYYEVIGSPGGNDFVFSGYATAASVTWFFPATYKAWKPVAPTVTKVGTWGVTNCGQPGIAVPSNLGFQLFIGSVGAGSMFTQNSNAGTCLTVEANP